MRKTVVSKVLNKFNNATLENPATSIIKLLLKYRRGMVFNSAMFLSRSLVLVFLVIFQRAYGKTLPA